MFQGLKRLLQTAFKRSRDLWWQDHAQLRLQGVTATQLRRLLRTLSSSEGERFSSSAQDELCNAL